MKNVVNLCLLIFLTSCSNKSSEKDAYEIDIKYYMFSDNIQTEKVEVERTRKADSVIFTYDYESLHDGIDSLIFFKDSISLKNTFPKFISKKNYKYHGKNFEILKFFYSSGHPHSFMNFYFNKENGIIFSKTGTNVNVEYLFEKGSETLLNQIKSDTTFTLLDSGNLP